MKVLKILGIGIALIVLLFVGISFFLPDTYHVERTVSIDSPAEQVHRLTSDLQNGWAQWEPWSEADDSVETTYGDVVAGVGAHQFWSSKDGNGTLTFTVCDVTQGIEYDMAFNVDQYLSKGKLRYTATATGTDVTWEMEGGVSGVSGKYFGYMMDSMVGPMFERGLTNLKTAVEALPPDVPG
jgi:hypothetical protein